MKTFRAYRQRSIEFHQLARVGRWTVKVYTITHRSSFESPEILENAVLNLPEWLEKSSQLNLPTYDTAFLIVHEGTDGVWTLVNWWTGGEILQGATFYTSFEKPDQFERVSKEGLVACVWELEVLCFERAMWIECVLKKSDNPDFAGYLQKHIGEAYGL